MMRLLDFIDLGLASICIILCGCAQGTDDSDPSTSSGLGSSSSTGTGGSSSAGTGGSSIGGTGGFSVGGQGGTGGAVGQGGAGGDGGGSPACPDLTGNWQYSAHCDAAYVGQVLVIAQTGCTFTTTDPITTDPYTGTIDSGGAVTVDDANSTQVCTGQLQTSTTLQLTCFTNCSETLFAL